MDCQMKFTKTWNEFLGIENGGCFILEGGSDVLMKMGKRKISPYNAVMLRTGEQFALLPSDLVVSVSPYGGMICFTEKEEK
ncbi:MAG: hypothetical protein [Bacteriophage sp.]|nr:MAG: hypothetical protein [Bacteriophage sp.]